VSGELQWPRSHNATSIPAAGAELVIANITFFCLVSGELQWLRSHSAIYLLSAGAALAVATCLVSDKVEHTVRSLATLACLQSLGTSWMVASKSAAVDASCVAEQDVSGDPSNYTYVL
jgi:hypothetical protein